MFLVPYSVYVPAHCEGLHRCILCDSVSITYILGGNLFFLHRNRDTLGVPHHDITQPASNLT